MRSVAQQIKRRTLPGEWWIVERLIARRMATDRAVAPWLQTMSDAEARVHFGGEAEIEFTHMRLTLRYFHAWRVQQLHERIPNLEAATMVDVGDSDGLMLRALGKTGVGVNTEPAAVEVARRNGIETILGDGQRLPFDDGTFEYALCFETLEHVESAYDLLCELGRVARRSVFVSIPWVARTHVLPRDPAAMRGAGHCIEFNRDDFVAFTTHTPLKVEYEAVCQVLAEPESLAERLFLWRHRNERTLASVFPRFQFFELAHA